MGDWIIGFVKTISEILTATIAVSSFSLLLFSFYFVRKEQLAQAFSLILICLTVIYSADALSTTTLSYQNQEIWQKIHWSGILFLPVTMVHFSQILLQMTGKSIRVFRKWGLIGMYLISGVFLVLLWQNRLFSGIRELGELGVSMIPSDISGAIWIWFFLLFIAIQINYNMTFKRTRTRTSRRRMLYLIVSSLGILIGTFPVMIFGSGIVSGHPLGFWLINVVANLLILTMVYLLGYSVITFCVSWSYRVIRLKLLEWVLRGPVTASLTLGIVTLVRRSSGVFGINTGGWTSILMVVSIIVLEYFVTFFMPLVEKNSFSGYGVKDYELVTGIGNMMVFSSELETYLESIISALCDKYQSKGAFAASIDANGAIETYVHVGDSKWDSLTEVASQLDKLKPLNGDRIDLDSGFVMPVFYHDLSTDQSWLLAILGIYEPAVDLDDADVENAMDIALEKIRIVLWQRTYVIRTFSVLKKLSDDKLMSSYRNINLLNYSNVLNQEGELELEDVSTWVRDALTQYWRGPRLTENPLMGLDIVRQEMNGDPNNATNALRSVLKRGIDQIRPEGERNISGEWTLYNILDLKFIEGLKVKEVARKLSISEADLYRKQKVAIEELAKTIIRMENNGSKQRVQ